MENRPCNVISIDVGTTYSTACYLNEKGNLEVLEDENGFPYIPSVVSYGNPIVVGTAAEKRKLAGKADTIYESKRIIAKDFNDPVVQNLIPYWPFTVVEGRQHRAGYKLVVKGKETVIYPEQVAADIIDYFCGLAEKKTNCPIDQVVITVPAFFDSNQRLATIQAVEFYQRRTCVLLMDEPSAAAVAFSVENDLEDKTLVVFDLGGGTFDVSLMKVKDKQYNVIRLDGDSNLGGATFNNILYGVIVKRIREKMQDPQREFTMKEEATIHSVCEQIKTNLSSITFQEMEVELEDEEVHIEVTRAEFENMIRPFITKAIQITLNCIKEAGMEPSQIDYVAMIGGSTSIPLIRTMLESTFPLSKVARSGDVRTAVARGAFIRLIEYMKSEELRRAAESGEKERFVMPARPRTTQEAVQPSGPGFVVVEDNGYITPERDNGYVVRDRGNGYVVRDRGNGYVVRDRGSGYVVRDRGNGYVVPDRGNGYVVPEEGGITPSQYSSDGFVVPEEGGIALSHPSDGFVVPLDPPADHPLTESVSLEQSIDRLQPIEYVERDNKPNEPSVEDENTPVVPPLPLIVPPVIDPVPPKEKPREVIPATPETNPVPTRSVEPIPMQVIPNPVPTRSVKPIPMQVIPKSVPTRSVKPISMQVIPNPPEVPDLPPLHITLDQSLDSSEEGGVVPSIPNPSTGVVVPIDISVVGLDVGIKVRGGKMFVMVPRATPLPFDSEPKLFSCDASNPVDIIVYQGNRPYATDNQRIGSTKTTVDTVYGSRKGRFYLRISVDRSNIVHVYRSYDKKEWSVLRDMENSLVFSEETIRKLRQQAEQWKELDEQFMKWVDVKNQFEVLLNQYIECSDKPGYVQEKADSWSVWFNDHRQPPKNGIITEECMTLWTNEVTAIQNELDRVLSLWVVCLNDGMEEDMSTNTFTFVSLLVWFHVRQ